ncbi:MAG: uL15 family ribosomal protein [Candidatus Aenigmatarchaeota archaeon]
MVVRRSKKNRKHRGKRTQGYGCHKKHRGSGSRGGSGQAGMHKHKWSYTTSYEPEHFGKRGFRPPKTMAAEVKAINIGNIEALAGGKNKIDLAALGYGKVLAGGTIGRPMEVIAPVFSRRAAEKIEAAGGKAEGVVAGVKEAAKAGEGKAGGESEEEVEEPGDEQSEEEE